MTLKINLIPFAHFSFDFILFLNEEQSRDHHGDGYGELSEEKTEHEYHRHLLKITNLNLKKTGIEKQGNKQGQTPY
jgi:hypothetical protein